MCITDDHDMTLAVKVALKPNTTNQLMYQINFTDPQLCDILFVIMHHEMHLTTLCYNKRHSVVEEAEREGERERERARAHTWSAGAYLYAELGAKFVLLSTFPEYSVDV